MMATRDEVLEKLNAMNDEEFSEFRFNFGGNGTREQYAEIVFREPKKEAKLCHVLGLETEEQKLNTANIRASHASVDSADSARRSADAAERSARWGFWAIVISILALLVSAVGIYVSAVK